MDQVTGGCLCGDVRIVATGRPNRVGLCHCLDCRKHHGALFLASAIVPADAVAIEGDTPGEETGGGLYAAPVAHAIFKTWVEQKNRPPAHPLRFKTE